MTTDTGQVAFLEIQASPQQLRPHFVRDHARVWAYQCFDRPWRCQGPRRVEVARTPAPLLAIPQKNAECTEILILRPGRQRRTRIGHKLNSAGHQLTADGMRE